MAIGWRTGVTVFTVQGSARRGAMSRLIRLKTLVERAGLLPNFPKSRFGSCESCDEGLEHVHDLPPDSLPVEDPIKLQD